MTTRSPARARPAKSYAVPSAKWDPAEYAANSSVQQAWARELIDRLKLRGDEHVLDVGCGDGKITAEIARAVPKGSVTGMDASPPMIEFAKKTFPPGKFGNLRFRCMDARHIRFERRFDLLFSNAALHWVDDHQTFLRGASAVLNPGGRLVVSCGGKGNAQDVFLALRPEMRLKRWRGFFRKIPTPYFFYAPSDYEKWLPKAGFEVQRVKLVPKDAVYPGAKAFATWLRTTWLPYVQRVPENLREEFITEIVQRYLAKHPVDADGKVHVKMVRLEIEASRIE